MDIHHFTVVFPPRRPNDLPIPQLLLVAITTMQPTWTCRRCTSIPFLKIVCLLLFLLMFLYCRYLSTLRPRLDRPRYVAARSKGAPVRSESRPALGDIAEAAGYGICLKQATRFATIRGLGCPTFHGGSVEFYGNAMENRSAGIHREFHGVSMEFHGIDK